VDVDWGLLELKLLDPGGQCNLNRRRPGKPQQVQLAWVDVDRAQARSEMDPAERKHSARRPIHFASARRAEGTAEERTAQPETRRAPGLGSQKGVGMLRGCGRSSFHPLQSHGVKPTSDMRRDDLHLEISCVGDTECLVSKH
jgi:hypothetical protein